MATPVGGGFPTVAQPWILVVGDSISSGYTLDPARTGVNSSWPVQMQAQLKKRGVAWGLFDTACPSETTETYRGHCAQHDKVASLPSIPQYDLAMRTIQERKPGLRAIVVELGANDLFQAAQRGDKSPEVVSGMKSRLDGIVRELRTAAPGVPVAVATVYDPFENKGDGELGALKGANDAIREVAKSNGAQVAYFFAVMNTPEPPDPRLCVLIDCAHEDIHPTIAGHAALAEEVIRALGSPARPR